MIHKIRNSRFSKYVASYLAIQMILTVAAPMSSFALTGGPSQPEFNSFTPIGTSDMVNLSSGDFNYNIPIMDVGGYPLNLAYDSGVSMDQEATWVGLGWNLNVGQITRQLRGLPDDFNGDEMLFENNMKENRTVGLTFNINPQFVGLGDMGLGVSAGITVQHNNYTGLSFQPSYGISFDITDQISVGANLTSSAASGATVSPYVGLSAKMGDNKSKYTAGLSSSFGVGYNSRQGLTNFNMSAGIRYDSDKIQGVRGNGKGSISFINNTYTPAKKNAYNNSSISFAASLGIDIWGIDAEIGVTGFGSIQKLKEKSTSVKAYGYNFSQNATRHDLLDFNKEKEDIVSKNTLVLPVTNYTYDIYQIQAQGTGGTFRPFRGQVGNLFSQYVQDESNSDSFGGEFEGGVGWHVGLDFTNVDVDSHTGLWQDPVTNYFEESYGDSNNPLYEQVYYKTIGENIVDKEAQIFNDRLAGNKPIRMGLAGANGAPGKTATNSYFAKGDEVGNTGTHTYDQIGFNSKFKRTEREIRKQSVTPLTAGQAQYDPLFVVNPAAKSHHVAGYVNLNPDGSRYVYGESAYNLTKREATFAVGQGPRPVEKGTVGFTSQENSVGNNSGTDNYFNAANTPSYAHTYLLTSVLSADYEDRTGDGISKDDLGAYTRFNYKKITGIGGDYGWRIPFNTADASYNQGLNSNTSDQKGSIVQGTKELKYIKTIDTKTHVAYFLLSDRADGQGASSGVPMQQLDKLFLFSKPEYDALLASNPSYGDDPDNVPIVELTKLAIKVAHFEYAQANGLVSGIPNGPFKLTLEKVYFTYRDSHMGKYTPYTFEYSHDYNGDGIDNNYAYSLKAYDIWGNYKPNEATGYGASDEMSPQEFPFVQQTDRLLQNEYASAWTMSAINLPSGGRIEVDFETDDYSHVQDRKAMQMFKVVGVTNESGGVAPTPSASDIGNDLLYNNGSYGNDARYLIVEIPEETAIDAATFRDRYIGDQFNKPIYFRFLLNMDKSAGKSNAPSSGNNYFDYVTGYFKILNHTSAPIRDTFTSGGKVYGAIPMEFTDLEGGVSGERDINPISKAGMYFGRRNLPKRVYGLDTYTTTSVSSIVNQLKEDFGAVQEIFIGPNAKLRNHKFIARRFKADKSWIRLLEPTGNKMGGGVRVANVRMHDQWAEMVNSTDDRYNQFYGQQYDYTLEDGVSTSGVATYEPNMSKENPFVEPFYNLGESLVAPREMNYTEKPFGESFFPSPAVTYSRVTVRNLQRDKEVDDGSGGTETITLTKHATGYVINEFYTSKDFPTIADYTTLDGPENYYSNDGDIIGQALGSLLGLNVSVTTELTLSQGFAIQTNNMNGKQKKQSVYNEYDEFISGAEYKYSIDQQEGTLNNKVATIDKNGQVVPREVGMSYEVINNFEENYAYTKTTGMQTNVVAIPLTIFVIVIPMVVPQSAEHTNVLHTVTTTKVINRSGILTEKIAYDLGASVTTKNLAWDADTGEVLLTETVNEYDDDYYSFNTPAYWGHKAMGAAATNVGLGGVLTVDGAPGHYNLLGDSGSVTNLDQIFTPGDEIMSIGLLDFIQGIFTGSFNYERRWVVDFNSGDSAIELMDREGNIVLDDPSSSAGFYFFRLDRSGYRNLQMASMASTTLMKNPIADGLIEASDFVATETMPLNVNPRVISASAVEYEDFWKTQCEDDFKDYAFPTNAEGEEYFDIDLVCFNPYVINVKGDFRAKKSYAYLTGRNTEALTSVRNEGFFRDYEPFYKYDGSDQWEINSVGFDEWTYASEVTQFSPFGAELENRDALGRYSSAQYGYEYTLPTAVSANSDYAQMGFDGFEDYDPNATQVNSHFGFQDAQNVNISTTTAHSGRNSIAVNPNNAVLIRKNLQECVEVCDDGSGGGSGSATESENGGN